MLFKGRKVSFLVCGTQKGGTTALTSHLRENPQIFMPDRKELHYFDDESLDWENPDYSGYEAMFKGLRKGQIAGEATPIYMYWRLCAERIRRYNKRMKIVVVLRNPVERAYSHWMMEWNRGNEEMSFRDAIREELKKMRVEPSRQDRVRSYVERGMYSEQVGRLFDAFGRRNVLLIKHEDLLMSHRVMMDKVQRFIGARPVETKQKRIHMGNYDSRLELRDRKELMELFIEDLRVLSEMVEWDCKEWIHV